ncbi:MAG TPA: hypothetical protein EYP90_10995 [Chromatiaceae bacterium]|nr:hypothetical protein [Chromatiaceae bacterium]
MITEVRRVDLVAVLCTGDFASVSATDTVHDLELVAKVFEYLASLGVDVVYTWGNRDLLLFERIVKLGSVEHRKRVRELLEYMLSLSNVYEAPSRDRLYLKTYPIQEVQAFMFGMSQGPANEWIHRLAKVLRMALDDLSCLPEREGIRLTKILRENETVTFTQDGTERRRQRPKDENKQKEYYSGKKKAHTVKNHLIIHPESRRVCFLSKTVPGKKHDKKLADESDLHFPALATLEQDTGFQGFDPEGVIILQPKKKPRGKDLSISEKFINRCISAGRIIAENVISGIKRCRIVKDVLRNWKSEFDDLVMELACGLHNLRETHRSLIESINLVDFYFQ